MSRAKLLIAICAISLLGPFRTEAQTLSTQKTDSHWFAEFQAGASLVASGEGTFFGMLSPAFSVNGGYRFSRPFGVRLAIDGYQGKGYVLSEDQYYTYRFVRTDFDFLWHPFAKLENLYFFAGPGLLVGLQNGALKMDEALQEEYFKDRWNAPKAFLTGRLGAGYAFRLCDSWSLTTEAIFNLMPDAVNSKHGYHPDCSVALMAGLRYAFPRHDCAQSAKKRGSSRREAAEMEAAAREAAAREAALAAEAEAREAAAREAAAREAEAREAAAREAALAAEAAAREAAAREAALAAEAEALAVQVYFGSSSSKVAPSYEAGLEKIAGFLQEHPEWKVAVTAYSDDTYGSAEYNRALSERRAGAVTRALVSAGVPASRIESVAAGGTNQFTVGRNVRKNRLVICQIVK